MRSLVDVWLLWVGAIDRALTEWRARRRAAKSLPRAAARAAKKEAP